MDNRAKAADIVSTLETKYPEDDVTRMASWLLRGPQAAKPIVENRRDEREENNLNVNMDLFRAYPNPFNPETTIMFNLAEAGYVNIGIYDVAGRKVAVIATGHYAAGLHRIAFNGYNLASGVYFARMQVHFANARAEKIMMQKLLLVK